MANPKLPPPRKKTVAKQPIHRMAAPRPAVAYGLFGISLGGVALMGWGLDHHHFEVIVVGWALSLFGGGLTVCIYFSELKRLRRFWQLSRGEWGETAVAISIALISVSLPPFLFSFRERAAILDVAGGNVAITPRTENSFAVNTDLINNGTLAALGFEHGCFFWLSDSELPREYEDAGILKAKENTSPINISGHPNQVAPGTPFRLSCFHDMTPEEYQEIKRGAQYIYLFVYMKYIDEGLNYGQFRVREQCVFYRRDFTIQNFCYRHNALYIVTE